MIKINLTAAGNEQTLIKEYLEQYASETLANKINYGVKIEKDNKILLNKKDLNSFMKYANDEARKLAEKGANCACIEDKVVFGWAIHYFEEDSIEGNLYNEDGTEFKVEPKTNAAPKTITKAPVKEQKKQASLFDLINLSESKQDEGKEEIEEDESESLPYKGQLAKHSQLDFLDEQDDEEDFTEDERNEIIETKENDKQTAMDNRLIDTETGEIIEPAPNKTSSIDKEFAIILYSLLDGKLEVK